jgi:hypothetical protein
MSTPRKIRIRKVADYGAGSSGHDHNYGFVFSDDLSDWQHSKRLKANLHMREVYRKSKQS